MDASGTVAGVTRPAITGAPATRWDVRAWVDDVYLTLHVAAMGFSLVLPLLGAAFSGAPIGADGVAWRLGIAFTFHLFAYALNDVCDLPVDRTEPQRADDPLVRGVIRRGTVLALAMLQLPLLAALWATGGASPRTGAALAFAVLSLAAYDRWGKSLRVPLLLDLVQGLGWAALLLAGVPADLSWAGPPATAAVAVVVYILLVNGLVGPLRDLANDHAAGAHTTALMLGVRPQGTGLRLTRRAAAWGLVLHGAFFAALLPLLRPVTLPWPGAVTVLGVAATWIALVAVPRTIGHRGRLARVGGGYVATTLGALVLTGMAAAHPALSVALCLAFAIPVGLMFVRNRRHWT